MQRKEAEKSGDMLCKKRNFTIGFVVWQEKIKNEEK